MKQKLSSTVFFRHQQQQLQPQGKAQVKGKAKQPTTTSRSNTSRRRRSSLPLTPVESFNEDEVLSVEQPQDQAPPQPLTLCLRGRSLGVGSMQDDGIVVRFESIPEEGKVTRTSTTAAASCATLAADAESSSIHQHYLRISDLRFLDSSLQSSLHGTSSLDPSRTEPPTTSTDHGDDDPEAVDQWLWLGCATNSPVAVNALAEVGWSVAMNRKLWTLASAGSSSSHQRLAAWTEATFQQQSPPPGELPVLVWTGKLHGLHRSDLPAVRAAAAVPASTRDLAELLVDSGRVRRYNPHSQGRVDLHVLQSSLEGGRYGGVTKIMRSSSKPPLVRKVLEFTTLLHARPILNGRGYLIVTRSVSIRHDGAAAASLAPLPLSSSSEILLSVNLLLPMSDRADHPGASTIVITVNHIHSPLIPMMLAKRIGVQAAGNFLLDLKQCVRTMGPCS